MGPIGNTKLPSGGPKVIQIKKSKANIERIQYKTIQLHFQTGNMADEQINKI